MSDIVKLITTLYDQTWRAEGHDWIYLHHLFPALCKNKGLIVGETEEILLLSKTLNNKRSVRDYQLTALWPWIVEEANYAEVWFGTERSGNKIYVVGLTPGRESLLVRIRCDKGFLALKWSCVQKLFQSVST